MVVKTITIDEQHIFMYKLVDEFKRQKDLLIWNWRSISLCTLN